MKMNKGNKLQFETERSSFNNLDNHLSEKYMHLFTHQMIASRWWTAMGY